MKWWPQSNREAGRARCSVGSTSAHRTKCGRAAQAGEDQTRRHRQPLISNCGAGSSQREPAASRRGLGGAALRSTAPGGLPLRLDSAAAQTARSEMGPGPPRRLGIGDPADTSPGHIQPAPRPGWAGSGQDAGRGKLRPEGYQTVNPTPPGAFQTDRVLDFSAPLRSAKVSCLRKFMKLYNPRNIPSSACTAPGGVRAGGDLSGRARWPA